MYIFSASLAVVVTCRARARTRLEAMYYSPSESCWSSFDLFPVEDAEDTLVDGLMHSCAFMHEDEIALRVDVLSDSGWAKPVSSDGGYIVGPKDCAVAKSKQGNIRKSCIQCGNEKTPQWRQGPNGPRSLCNACGVAFMKGGCEALKNRSPPLCRQSRP